MADNRSEKTMLRVREYGTSGPPVIVLHGGPGAPGYMAPVARGLCDRFRVFEPFQRGSGGERLTVARHVDDLHELVTLRRESLPPALVGSSFGAMLALAYAAAHPDVAGPLVLIGCGTFDRAARRHLQTTLETRKDPALRRRLGRLVDDFPDPDERLETMGNLLLPLYSHDPMQTRLELESCDSRAHYETWKDMVRLQEEGVYPAAFKAISSPVLMLHGAEDPHPGRMIRASLAAYLPQLTYHEWERCGHYPWQERAVREDFFEVLRKWLLRHANDPFWENSQNAQQTRMKGNSEQRPGT